ncbi:2-dehydro-3-deoxygluconokinase [Bacillus sp. FJAT-27225]|uniref:sugar kinase n=1 Tax=Bacillus sp. FJAT-27225 TaxID=1743144 RepID=UPI00080C24B6|nr:sugar kinase [Bacillus sp. FJAT-27225]OCA85931.1 2-dehydro-3-deoxygluconokinase [Bacillus sp. FJAT-27225]
MSKILIFGEPMAMFTAETEGPLEEVDLFRKSVAGAEVNVCTGLARLGHTVSYVTKLGQDPMGLYIKNFLNREGISTEFVTFDPIYKTATQLKSKVTEGDPVVAYYRKGSAFSHVSAEYIDQINLDGIDLVHVTGIPPALSLSCREATFRLMERARERGIYITFDPNLRPSLWESKEVMVNVINELAAHANLILPGVSEGKILTGTDVPEEIADFYQELGAEEVVIKLGCKGAYVKTQSESFYKEGFKVEKVIDTVGAGDGFAVGVITGKLEGLSIQDTITRANAIGAIQVTFVSDNEGLPTRKELDQFIRRHENETSISSGSGTN